MSIADRHPIAGRAGTEEVAFGPASDPADARTAAQLRADAHATAARLPDPFPGSQVALICGDRYHFAAALLGAWEAGHGAALPPNPRPETVKLVASRPNVCALIHDTDEEVGRDLRPWLGSEAGDRPLRPLEPARLSATVYTSGSTGTFQPWAKTMGQVFTEVNALLDSFGLRGPNRFLPTVPSHHFYGLLFSVCVPLVGGGSFLRTTPLHAETVADAIRRTRATFLVTVPAHLRGFEIIEPGAAPGLRGIYTSTAPLHPSTATMMMERHGYPVTEAFGSTETGAIAWRRQVETTLWQPLEGIEVSEHPQTGRLLVRSPFLGSDVAQPFETGDRIRMHPDGGGRFEHLGRADSVVKVGGKRIALAQIEAHLLELDGVEDAAVVALDDDGGRNVTILAAVVAPGWTNAQLRRALLRWFERSTLPRRLVSVDALPREANGKIIRSRLLALFEHEGERPRQLELLSERIEPEPDGGTSCKLRLRVPEDLYYFEGHFPDMPILPGVVQLREIVLRYVRRHRPELGRVLRLKRVKFRQPILPGEEVDVALRFPAGGGGSVLFFIESGGVLCASGRVELLAEGASD